MSDMLVCIAGAGILIVIACATIVMQWFKVRVWQRRAIEAARDARTQSELVSELRVERDRIAADAAQAVERYDFKQWETTW